jgi:hypothetical protein
MFKKVADFFISPFASRKQFKKLGLLLFFLCGFAAAAAQAQNATIVLQWDPPTDLTGITGYRVYARTAGGSYTSNFYSVSGSANTALTISDLPVGSYFFVTKSFNGVAESAPSNEIALTALVTPLEGLTAAQQQGSIITAQVFSPGSATALFTSNSTSNANGVIVIPGGATGLPSTFDLRLNAPRYLARRLTNRSRTDLSPTPALLAGDIDDSGVINSIDYAPLKQSWGGTSATADLNKDGVVNSFDYGFLKKNWFLADAA